MNPDEFEQRLQEEAFRPIPPEWRHELLREARLDGAAPAVRAPAARAPAVRAPAVRAPAPWPENGPREWLRDWLWPAPAAWAALAACWVAVLILNRSALPSAAEMAETQANARLALAYQTVVRESNALQIDDPAPAPKPPVASPPRRAAEPPQARMRRPNGLIGGAASDGWLEIHHGTATSPFDPRRAGPHSFAARTQSALTSSAYECLETAATRQMA